MQEEPSQRHEHERLLSESAKDDGAFTEMTRMGSHRDQRASHEIRSESPSNLTHYHDDPLSSSIPADRIQSNAPFLPTSPLHSSPAAPAAPYRLYPIRFFGLFQPSLLKIVVSWFWLSYVPVSNTAADFFSTTPRHISWLSTGFLFAFVVASPPTVYALHKGGPRLALIIASLLILLGNWIRYAGTRAMRGESKEGNLRVVMFGQILIGLAQPFVLAAPTRFSDLWFSPQGRVTATAVASLANPFGGALGQLITPFLCTKASEIPNMTLYVAIISTVATIPTLFLPAKPPTPASSSSSASPTNPKSSSLASTIKSTLVKNPSFHLLTASFTVYVSLFNALSSLLTPLLTPYAFSETQSGIAGGLLILIGLVSSAITSPILDRYNEKPWLRLLVIKTLVPTVALAYLAFIFAPGTVGNGRGGVAPVYVISSILGAASFSLVPIALEFLVDVTYPAGAEFSSTIAWAGGQLFGGIFIIVAGKLMGDGGKGTAGGEAATKEGTIRALVFFAVMAVLGAIPAMMLKKQGGGGGRGRGR